MEHMSMLLRNVCGGMGSFSEECPPRPALPRLPVHFRSHSTYEPRLLTIFLKRFHP